MSVTITENVNTTPTVLTTRPADTATVRTPALHTALGDDTNSNLLISSVFRQWRYFRRRLRVGKMPFFYFLDWCLLSAVFNILSFGWKIELYKTGRLEKYFTTLSTYSKIFENFWVNVTWPPKSAQCALFVLVFNNTVETTNPTLQPSSLCRDIQWSARILSNLGFNDHSFLSHLLPLQNV